jgi:hypothetical protein
VAAHEERALEVHPDDTLQSASDIVTVGPLDPDAGAVDENIEASEAADGFRYGPLAVGDRTDVGDDPGRLPDPIEAGDRRSRAGSSMAREREPDTLTGQMLRGRQADPAGGAGDRRDVTPDHLSTTPPKGP